MPKSIAIDLHVAGTPEEVARRLQEQTRWSLYPFQGSLIRFGDKPLKGTVNANRFKVGSNHRDVFTLMQPVARCTLERTAHGTKIQGSVGLPRLLVWWMRFAVMIMVPMIVLSMIGVVLSSGGTLGWLVAVLFSLFAILCCIFGVGINMNNANGMVDDMHHQLHQLLGGVSPSPQAAGLSEQVPSQSPIGQLERQ